MTSLIAFGVIVLALLGFMAFAYARGRSAGATTERAKVATKTVDVLKAQDKAGAKAARTDDGVIEALSKGEF